MTVGSGSTTETSSSGTQNFDSKETGNRYSAKITRTQTGGNRYTILPMAVNNTSDGANGGSGMLDFSPVGSMVSVQSNLLPAGVFTSTAGGSFGSLNLASAGAAAPQQASTSDYSDDEDDDYYNLYGDDGGDNGEGFADNSSGGDFGPQVAPTPAWTVPSTWNVGQGNGMGRYKLYPSGSQNPNGTVSLHFSIVDEGSSVPTGVGQMSVTVDPNVTNPNKIEQQLQYVVDGLSNSADQAQAAAAVDNFRMASALLMVPAAATAAGGFVAGVATPILEDTIGVEAFLGPWLPEWVYRCSRREERRWLYMEAQKLWVRELRIWPPGMMLLPRQICSELELLS